MLGPRQVDTMDAFANGEKMCASGSGTTSRLDSSSGSQGSVVSRRISKSRTIPGSSSRRNGQRRGSFTTSISSFGRANPSSGRNKRGEEKKEKTMPSTTLTKLVDDLPTVEWNKKVKDIFGKVPSIQKAEMSSGANVTKERPATPRPRSSGSNKKPIENTGLKEYLSQSERLSSTATGISLLLDWSSLNDDKANREDQPQCFDKIKIHTEDKVDTDNIFQNILHPSGDTSTKEVLRRLSLAVPAKEIVAKRRSSAPGSKKLCTTKSKKNMDNDVMFEAIHGIEHTYGTSSHNLKTVGLLLETSSSCDGGSERARSRLSIAKTPTRNRSNNGRRGNSRRRNSKTRTRRRAKSRDDSPPPLILLHSKISPESNLKGRRRANSLPTKAVTADKSSRRRRGGKLVPHRNMRSANSDKEIPSVVNCNTSQRRRKISRSMSMSSPRPSGLHFEGGVRDQAKQVRNTERRSPHGLRASMLERRQHQYVPLVGPTTPRRSRYPLTG